MTAKSETVGVALTDEQAVIAQGLFIYEVDYSPEENWRGVRLDNVRKLIDKHESALAKCQLDYLAANRAALRWRDMRDFARAERDTLISGLEALAGEMEKDAANEWYHDGYRNSCRRYGADIRALIPAAAKEE